MKSYEVEMNLYTLSPHESQRSILAEVRRCVSTREDYEVHFMHPVQIRRDRVYHVRLGFKVRSCRKLNLLFFIISTFHIQIHKIYMSIVYLWRGYKYIFN